MQQYPLFLGADVGEPRQAGRYMGDLVPVYDLQNVHRGLVALHSKSGQGLWVDVQPPGQGEDISNG